MNLKTRKHFLEIKNVNRANSNDSIIIRGQFDIPYQQLGMTVQGTEVLKHIILVVTRGGNRTVSQPFKDVILFEEDIKESDEGCHGFFNFNLFDKISFSGAGDYYIMCSLGTTTSNILKVSI